MYQVARSYIKKKNKEQYKTCDYLTFLSKNIYNASIYDRKKHYALTGKSKTFFDQINDFTNNNNPDYYAFGSTRVARETMRLVDSSFKSFYSLLKKKKNNEYDKPVKPPRYLDSVKGRQVVTFPKGAISKNNPEVKPGVYEITLCPKSVNAKLLSPIQNPVAVRIIPRKNRFQVDFTYEIDDVEFLEDNNRYASLDCNVNNIALFANCVNSVLFNTKPIKSINQYYNKMLARFRSELPREVKTSKRIYNLNVKRKHKIDWELHNLTCAITDYLVNNEINTLIIGYNKDWKQGVNMGKRNNQNFVGIPFSRIISLLKYKCAKLGVSVILKEESYTSKCSFLDKEPIRKSKHYTGRRVHRGLFKSSDGRVIHADVNAAGNIMRKVVPDELVYLKGIVGFTVNPITVTIKSHPTRFDTHSKRLG